MLSLIHIQMCIRDRIYFNLLYIMYILDNNFNFFQSRSSSYVLYSRKIKNSVFSLSKKISGSLLKFVLSPLVKFHHISKDEMSVTSIIMIKQQLPYNRKFKQMTLNCLIQVNLKNLWFSLMSLCYSLLDICHHWQTCLLYTSRCV